MYEGANGSDSWTVGEKNDDSVLKRVILYLWFLQTNISLTTDLLWLKSSKQNCRFHFSADDFSFSHFISLQTAKIYFPLTRFHLMVFHEEIPENRSLLKGLCQRFWKAPFICQDLSHCLIVSKVFYYKSFYGGYRRSFLALFLGSFARGIFFTWIYSVLLSGPVILTENQQWLLNNEWWNPWQNLPYSSQNLSVELGGNLLHKTRTNSDWYEFVSV